MKLKISIRLDNSAFVDQMNGAEISRILNHIANQTQNHNWNVGDGGNIRDINGNLVGEFKIVKG